MGARCGAAPARCAGTLRRRSPLALRLALAALAIAPHALTVVATKRRESNKTGVLYSGGAVSATTSPLRGSKTAVLYGSRFCCRSSNIVRCACGVPAAPPRYRMAPPPEGGLRADGFAVSSRTRDATPNPGKCFLQSSSNTPPPRNLCGEHRTPTRRQRKSPDREIRAHIFRSLPHRQMPTVIKSGCLGKRRGLTSSVIRYQDYITARRACQGGKAEIHGKFRNCRQLAAKSRAFGIKCALLLTKCPFCAKKQRAEEESRQRLPSHLLYTKVLHFV